MGRRLHTCGAPFSFQDADDIAAYKKRDAHNELKRWLGGDRRPNNEDRHGVSWRIANSE